MTWIAKPIALFGGLYPRTCFQWKWVAALAALTLLPLPASALTISGTAPANADSGGTCTNPVRVPRSGSMWVIVRMESGDLRAVSRDLVPPSAILRRDSVTVSMGSPFSLTVPTPTTPGLYTFRAYGRRAASPYGCDTTMIYLLDIFAPAKPGARVQ